MEYKKKLGLFNYVFKQNTYEPLYLGSEYRIIRIKGKIFAPKK